MASFDPSIPQTSDPLYIHFSHPIEAPKPISPGADIYEGITKGLEGVKTIDKAFEKHAEFLGEQEGEKQQADFLTAVRTVDSLTQPADNVPDGVKQGIDRIQRNQDAYGQGKVRETEYYKNLYEGAKSLRTQWPAYRDHIDKGIEKATGITPNANAYIKSLLAEINERTTKANKFEDHAVSQAYEAIKHDPHMSDNLEAYHKGAIDVYELNRRTNLAYKGQIDHRVFENQVAEYEGNKKIQIDLAKDAITSRTVDLSNQTMNALFTNMGLGDEKLRDVYDRFARGEDPNISDEQWLKGAQFLKNRMLNVKNQLDTEFSKPINDPRMQGRSLRNAAGDQYNDHVKKGMDQMTDMLEALTHHDIGAMYTNKQAVDAIVHRDTYQVFQDKDLGPTFRMIGAANKAGGSMFIPQLLTGPLAGTIPMPKRDLNGVSSLIQNLMTGSKFKGIDTTSKAIDTVISEGRGDPNPTAVKAVATAPAQGIISEHLNDEAKINLINSTFKTNNDGMLGKIEADYTTPDGRKVAGKNAIYEAYGTSKLATEVKRLNDTYGLGIKDNYLGWMEHSFARDIFKNDLSQLSAIEKQPQWDIKLVEPPDGSAPRFEGKQIYRGGMRQGQSGMTPRDLPPAVQQIFDRVNSGIRSLGNAYDAFGEKGLIKSRVLQIMRENGIEPNVGNSVARAMMIGIGATKKPEPEGKDQSRAGGN